MQLQKNEETLPGRNAARGWSALPVKKLQCIAKSHVGRCMAMARSHLRA